MCPVFRLPSPHLVFEDIVKLDVAQNKCSFGKIPKIRNFLCKLSYLKLLKRVFGFVSLREQEATRAVVCNSRRWDLWFVRRVCGRRL